MADMLESKDLEFGDAVLNFGDSIYRESAERRAQDNVLRLCAYALFANRVGLPTRHVIQNGSLFQVLQWMPSLLQDGLVFVDVPNGSTSVVENVDEAKYAGSQDEQFRARFLDEHSKVLHTFDASGMMKRFREQFLGDLAENGAFRRLLQKHFGTVGPGIADDLATRVESLPPLRHDAFLVEAHSACPEFARTLVTRWASVRYYTTPMDFDVCVREVPTEASSLLLEAEAYSLVKGKARDALADLPEPIRSAVEVMDIGFPIVFTEGDARCLVDAVLKTRERVPEARQKFSSVVCDAFGDDLRQELNAVLRDNYQREQLLRTGSPALSDAFKAGIADVSVDRILDAADSALGKVVEVATVQLSPVVGGIRAVAAPWFEDRRLRAAAPWKTTCEYLRHTHKGSILSQLHRPST